ncbi:MAG: hypothetical protein G01um101425_800 [Candidatus Peregrinibacteria bacterium Gr01-1014_25]|nr:MAG: hypothetical protein G01um101425_800 [Candidatus Peregrinibacteria bacterium Gr01-1014_25]
MERIRHRIVRTRNKHSRAVYRGDTIVIRLARNLSRSEEREHITSLLRRMTQLVLLEQRKTLIAPFRHLLDGGQSLTVRLACGRRIAIQLQPRARSSARRTGTNQWTVGVGPQLRRRALHRLLWRIVAVEERARVEQLVRAINRKVLRVPVRDVRLQFASSQWGSCSPHGTIMLNAALLFVPPSLLTYVIVHELAHRRVTDHSDAYWAVVERALPSYKRAYHALQQYRLPSL